MTYKQRCEIMEKALQNIVRCTNIGYWELFRLTAARGTMEIIQGVKEIAETALKESK